RKELGARAGRGERGGERTPCGSLRVNPDGETARVGERPHELLCGVRLQRAGRIVEEHAYRAELGQYPRSLDQRLDLAGAAGAVKRGEKSASTGRVPTRKRARSASPSGVLTRALRARIRSHGLSTPRLTAASKQPPPETSRYAKPALSRISASRSCSEAGTRPASGSCPSRRIVVSASDGTRGAYRGRLGLPAVRSCSSRAPTARAPSPVFESTVHVMRRSGSCTVPKATP